MLDTIMEIESIVKAVESKVISRSTGSALIKHVLAGKPTEELIETCNECGKEHLCQQP